MLWVLTGGYSQQRAVWWWRGRRLPLPVAGGAPRHPTTMYKWSWIFTGGVSSAIAQYQFMVGTQISQHRVGRGTAAGSAATRGNGATAARGLPLPRRAARTAPAPTPGTTATTRRSAPAGHARSLTQTVSSLARCLLAHGAARSGWSRTYVSCQGEVKATSYRQPSQLAAAACCRTDATDCYNSVRYNFMFKENIWIHDI